MSITGEGIVRKSTQRLTQREGRPSRRLFASVRDAASRESEARFRSYIELAPLAVLVVDRAGRCVEANRNAEQMLGYDRETLAGMGLEDAVPEEEREAAWRGLGTVLRVGSAKGRLRLRARGGDLISVSVRAARLSAGRAIVYCLDITEARQAEEALYASEARFSSIFHASPITISISQLGSGRFVDVNPAFEARSGYTRQELIGRTSGEISLWHNPQDRETVATTLRRQGTVRAFETSIQIKSGEVRDVLMSAELLELGGEPHMLCLTQDITERRQAEEALRESEFRFRTYVEMAPIAVLVADRNGYFIDSNSAAIDLLGYDAAALAGMRISDLHPADDRELVERTFQTLQREGRVESEFRMKRRDGGLLWILLRAVMLQDGRSLAYCQDMTERKRMEEALRQAQKFESLGVLAGGVAHDFNNLLVALLGQTSLALARLEPESPARPAIQKAVKAAQHAADLTRQLLAYSGRGRFAVQPLRLNALIEENLGLLEVAVPKNVYLAAELGEELPLILADTGQMQQVLMNLIINAAEAIGSRPGTVTVRTGVREVSASERHLWPFGRDPFPAGRYVVLQVCDDGCGMDAVTLPRIFDPFFTTTFTGRGLGLAAVSGIVKGHQGGLRVESRPGAGTTFYLAFPAAAEGEAKALEPPVAAPAAIPLERRPELILLVDDEEPVRTAVTDILEMKGLRVLAAPNGKEGLAIYRQHRADVLLVLLDLSMPGMSGEETFRELRAVDPGLRIILSSGYDEGEVSARFAGDPPTGFLQKPYSVETLTAAIERYLAAG